MSVRSYMTKQGRRYHASLWMQNQRICSKGGFLTKKEAKQWLVEKELRREFQPPEPGMGFRDTCNLYLDHIQERRKFNTYIYKRSVLKKAVSSFQDMHIRHITFEHIENHIKVIQQSISPKSANRHLMEIGAVFNFAIRKNLCQHNPCRQVERYAEESYRRYVPPAEDIAAVIMAAQGIERDMLICQYHTGARQVEILSLAWDDVNFENRCITLWTSKRSGGNREPRNIAMTDELHSILWRRWSAQDKSETWVFENPRTGTVYHRGSKEIRSMFKRLCHKAGVKYFSSHAVRHHVATVLKDSHKATPFQIQRFLGHMNLRTTERYLHELDVDRGIAEILEYARFPESSAHNSAHEDGPPHKKSPRKGGLSS